MSAAINTITDWNAKFPIGQPVIVEGKPYKTASHAGLDWRHRTPVVFVGSEEDFREPVPLERIEVPGYVHLAGKQSIKAHNKKKGKK